jgi:hypothetical protein
MQTTMRYSAGAALDLRPDGVLLVRLIGPLTGAALQHVKADIGARFQGRCINAFFVDFSSSAIALDGDDLDAVLHGEHHGTASSAPAAMVVPAAMLGLFVGHCLRMAQRGIVRAAFTDAGRALRWATRHAQRAKTET